MGNSEYIFYKKGDEMRKIIILLISVVCLSTPCVSFAEHSELKKFLPDFEKSIRVRGYTCPKAEKIRAIGYNNESDMEFLIACDENLKYLYYVLIRGDKTTCVEPYVEKGKKCR